MVKKSVSEKDPITMQAVNDAIMAAGGEIITEVKQSEIEEEMKLKAEELYKEADATLKRGRKKQSADLNSADPTTAPRIKSLFPNLTQQINERKEEELQVPPALGLPTLQQAIKNAKQEHEESIQKAMLVQGVDHALLENFVRKLNISDVDIEVTSYANNYLGVIKCRIKKGKIQIDASHLMKSLVHAITA